MGDCIYISIVVLSAFAFAVWYIIIEGYPGQNVFSLGEYGSILKARRRLKFAFYLTFAILSFLLSLLDIKLNFTKIMAFIYSFVSLIFVFNDVFVKNIKKDRYIIALQKYAEEERPFLELFVVKENNAKYDLSNNENQMMFKVVKAETGDAICQEAGDKNIIFIPKCNMSEAEIWFICRQINIYWTYHNKLPPTVVCLKNKLFYDHIDDYVWELFPKAEFWFSERFNSKLKKVLLFKAMIFLIVVSLIFLLDKYLGCNIGSNIAKWLLSVEK